MNRITFATFVCITLGACFHQDAQEDSRFTWAAEPCELAHTVYEVDRIITPRTPNEAEQLGFNLDHDRYHRVDNAAGILLANLHQQGLGDGAVREFDPAHDAWFVHVARCVDERVDDYVRASVSLSRRYARAGAPFPAVGYAERNRLFVGGGSGLVPLSVFFPGRPADLGAQWVAGLGLTIRARQTAGGRLAGEIGVALDLRYSRYEYDDAIVADRLIPDVDLLDGQGGYHPRRDGELDHVSLGFGFTAVKVRD